LHFTEWVNGKKEKVYTDDVKTKEELVTLIEEMNRNFVKVLGAAAEMKPGKTEIKTIMGIKDDGSIN
jgi:tRNA A37 threonylcarbamoyladenosine dehydratase